MNIHPYPHRIPTVVLTFMLALPAATGADPASSRGGEDHVGNFNFRLEIDGASIGGFASVSDLSASTEVLEFRAGAEGIVRKIPGRTTYENIVLKRGFVADDALHEWIWANLDTDGTPDRRDGAFVFVNASGEEVVRYDFASAWPCRWELLVDEGGDDQPGPQVVIEEVAICVEYFQEN